MEAPYLDELLLESQFRWFRFRRHFPASLPALVMVIAGAGLALADWQTSALELSGRYVHEADRALRTRDDARARTFFRKALTLVDDSRLQDRVQEDYQR